MSEAPEGIIYSCSGERYVVDAIRSARSSLLHNRVPHLVFASPMPTGANPGEASLSFQPFVPSGNPFADRIGHMRSSPFERTVYLDSDTYVAGEITQVLRLLDRYDVAVAHAPGYRGLADPDVPQAFYEFNCGVVAWRRNDRTAAFLARWQDTYAAWLKDSPFAGAGTMPTGIDTPANDQPAFRHCAWHSDVYVIVLGPEYNLRVGYPSMVADDVRIVHGRHTDYSRLIARLNEKRGPRTYTPVRFSRRGRALARLRRVTGASVASTR